MDTLRLKLLQTNSDLGSNQFLRARAYRQANEKTGVPDDSYDP